MTFLLFLFAMALIILFILSNVEKPKRIIRIRREKPRDRRSVWPFTDRYSTFG